MQEIGKNQRRAVRRHHVARVKNRIRRFFIFTQWTPLSPRDEARRLSRLAITKTPCSCWMCGNPRKFFGDRSIQEQGFAELTQQEISSWDGKSTIRFL